MGNKKHRKGFGESRSLRDLRRAPPSRRPRISILVVCEDSVSAPAYFKAWRRKCGLNVLDVEVIGEGFGSDPYSVITEAIARREERKITARKSPRAVPYNQVWCVFDREAPGNRPEFDQAVHRAREAGIRLAVSNPCFEVWVLLHFEDTCRPFVNCREVVAYLKKHHLPEYKKGCDCFPVLVDRTRRAIDSAEKSLKIKAPDEFANSSTYVHHLVIKIIGMAGSTFKLPALASDND